MGTNGGFKGHACEEVPSQRTSLELTSFIWAAQARAYSGEGHSEEWRFEFSRPYLH